MAKGTNDVFSSVGSEITMTTNPTVTIAAKFDHYDFAIWTNLDSFGLLHGIWRGGRVVECTGLGNRYIMYNYMF